MAIPLLCTIFNSYFNLIRIRSFSIAMLPTTMGTLYNRKPDKYLNGASAVAILS